MPDEQKGIGVAPLTPPPMPLEELKEIDAEHRVLVPVYRASLQAENRALDSGFDPERDQVIFERAQRVVDDPQSTPTARRRALSMMNLVRRRQDENALRVLKIQAEREKQPAPAPIHAHQTNVTLQQTQQQAALAQSGTASLRSEIQGLVKQHADQMRARQVKQQGG